VLAEHPAITHTVNDAGSLLLMLQWLLPLLMYACISGKVYAVECCPAECMLAKWLAVLYSAVLHGWQCCAAGSAAQLAVLSSMLHSPHWPL
jgi:hypothetical protein